MIKEFYHVVTNKPMYVGQEITFDDNHHSGVYERVHAYDGKIKDIYSNPDNYKDVEFEHHLKVALRELAMEEVRKNIYPNYPSRLASLYVSRTLEEAERWFNLFIRWGRPTFQIVKVEVDGNIYIGDVCNCFDGTIDKKENLKLAEEYWINKKNNKGKTPIVEVLVDGKIKVTEIIKENK